VNKVSRIRLEAPERKNNVPNILKGGVWGNGVGLNEVASAWEEVIFQRVISVELYPNDLR
jgi:hypothetical protein